MRELEEVYFIFIYLLLLPPYITVKEASSASYNRGAFFLQCAKLKIVYFPLEFIALNFLSLNFPFSRRGCVWSFSWALVHHPKPTNNKVHHRSSRVGRGFVGVMIMDFNLALGSKSYCLSAIIRFQSGSLEERYCTRLGSAEPTVHI